jgi:ATP-binding protein involved in chromosome partitioning
MKNADDIKQQLMQWLSTPPLDLLQPYASTLSIHTQGPGPCVVTFTVPQNEAAKLEAVTSSLQQKLRGLEGYPNAMVLLTAERETSKQSQSHTQEAGPKMQSRRIELPTVKHVVAVASGKGGVGKSTTTANLAVALMQLGLRVGVMDADIYGPSIPTLMGLVGQKPQQDQNGQIMPLRAHGLQIMSIGFMVDPSAALIWRGPMVTSALRQLLADVAWEGLDVLLIDMPPGTGDVQLTLAQQAPLSGAIIISTPQEVALADVRRAVSMFRKVEVPILGLLENMSVFVCPSDGVRYEIFGHGGARKEAMQSGMTFLGEVPILPKLAECSDQGAPYVAKEPESPITEVYKDIAMRVWEALVNPETKYKVPPKIIFET